MAVSLLLSLLSTASAAGVENLVNTAAGTVARTNVKTTMDGIVSKWNNTDFSKMSGSTMVTVWSGATAASGCAAFSRYAFYSMYGHGDNLKNTSNTVSTYTVNNVNDLLKTLTMNAAPGDAVRVSRVEGGKESQTRTHIFILYDIESSGKINTYESNYTTTNVARAHSYASPTALATNSGPKLTVSGGSFNYPMLVKIIHAKENKNTSAYLSYDGNGSAVINPGSSSTTTVKYGKVHDTDGNLAINSKAASGYMIGKIPEGGVCTVYPDKASGNWYWVEYNGVQGYSYGKYITLSDTKPAPSTPAPTSTGAIHGTIHDTAGNLAINQEPKSTANGATMLGKIPEGGTCVVYPGKASGKWYWVEYHGVQGYAYGSYITLNQKAHSMDCHVDAKAPTYTTVGAAEYWYCSVCRQCYLNAAGTSYTSSPGSSIPATGHSLEHFKALSPSCTEDGNMEYWHCTDCGKYFSNSGASAVITLADTVLDPLGHDYQDGSCTRCGEADPDYEEPALDNPFTDVYDSDYYYDAVLWAYYNEPQITTGVSADRFGPGQTCTRGQVATFLWRAMGEPKPATRTNPFGDIKTSDYYYKAILWAVEEGITNGTSTTTFSPNQTCSNAHILTFLWRCMGEQGKTGRGTWYDDAVNWADRNGMLDYGKKAFSPLADCPRGDVVLYLWAASE